jgi:hypothetical protein
MMEPAVHGAVAAVLSFACGMQNMTAGAHAWFRAWEKIVGSVQTLCKHRVFAHKGCACYKLRRAQQFVQNLPTRRKSKWCRVRKPIAAAVKSEKGELP